MMGERSSISSKFVNQNQPTGPDEFEILIRVFFGFNFDSSSFITAKMDHPLAFLAVGVGILNISDILDAVGSDCDDDFCLFVCIPWVVIVGLIA